MVEEAAEDAYSEIAMTRLRKMTGKKENPVDEITALLSEEIAPKLDTHRAERRAFMKYHKGQRQT
jgi:structural maintenance of chromosome 2